ncbi:thiamine-phosphate kinase [Frondihabitans sp. PhB188]|uniref:thiamine-phosphate kinase n=1 Tax=Frondihabitans sp. PhB188 TaxID=2485200 RepID=UPI000F479239|nr:thiamine-phosphate kinase [Frondihabitans sp. PhB188]ROQ41441.1 thiamine-phosphate kinase [Frondihabitans sp. PhB188]
MSESAATSAPETVESLGEVATLGRILPRLPKGDRTLLGPGDDAAVVAAADGRFVVTTDLMVHGPDFRLAWSTPYDLGWKAAASNFTDVAAMGAAPTALVVALAVPGDTEAAFLERFADGLADGCAVMAPGCGVVGGDMSVSRTMTIAVTAFGDLDGRAPVRRDGARPGDLVAVSGVLGDSGSGLERLFAEAVDGAGTPDRRAADALRLSDPRVAWHLAPTPPVADGVLAAVAGATAMLDLSDGLALDAGRVARASGVTLDLVGSALGPDPLAALRGGEDHSLLATFPADAVLPGGFRPVGVVRAGEHVVLLDGAPLADATGWDPYARWSGGVG